MQIEYYINIFLKYNVLVLKREKCYDTENKFIFCEKKK